MRLTRVVVLSLATLAAGAAGCEKKAPAAKAEATAVKEISVDELAGQLAKAAVKPVDANGDKTRRDVGFIPGAVLLTDYDTFGAAEQPTDKRQPLVFYCANEQCSASHEAAKRAIALGHADDKVLPAGIMGWAKAGQRTEKL